MRPSPLEHQQDIRREQDEMDAALHDVRVAAGEGDDRDAERHDQQPLVRVLHAPGSAGGR